jgi:hypothetical protein
MFLQVVIWIVVGIAALVVGKEVGKWLFGAKQNLTNARRAVQSLAISLRQAGLVRVPEVFEEFVVGDVPDLLLGLEDLAKLLKAGNETILKELDQTFERVLGVKLSTPEGRAVIKAKLDEAAKVAVVVAKVAAPVAVALL